MARSQNQIVEHLRNHHEKRDTMGDLIHIFSLQKKQVNTKIIPFIIIGIWGGGIHSYRVLHEKKIKVT